MLWSAASVPAIAQNQSQEVGEAPFLLSADQVIYDNELGQVTAKGSVEISSAGRTLLADSVNYNQRDGVVTANGNLTLMEPSGEVIFAEHLRLSEDLTTGFIESIRILLTDKSRFAANSAERRDVNQMEMNKAVYSPCEICKKDPDRAPLWQLKAVKVIHRRDEHEIEYRHAILEFFGIPVAYTPYFRHADPLTPRKSGFLAPELGSSSELGTTIQIPYFWAIDRARDLTFAPIITSEQEVVLTGEYRALTALGGYEGEASLTYTDKRNDNNERLNEEEIRGHIDAFGRFDIDQTWRWGFDLERSTDDTYLKRYNFSGEDTLTSSLFTEGFRGRHYMAASAYTFQGLEIDDDPGTTPLVAPLLDYSASLEPEQFPGRVYLDASAVSLHREDGFDSRRLSMDGRWQLPYVADAGDIYTLIAGLGMDLYHLDDFVESGSEEAASGDEFQARLRPTVALDWRFPFVRRDGTVRQVIEPVAQLILTPYGGNPKGIPNEDSRSLEFDDTNLFSLNRFPGHDRVEGGPRANLGLKASVHGISGGYSSLTVGQVFRARDDDTFAEQTGLDDHRSDYVTALTVSPSPFFDLTNRLRLDRNTFSLRRNEIYFSVGPDYLRFNTTYISLEREQTVDELGAREELYNNVRWKIDKRWNATAESRRDLRDGGNQIRAGAGMQYLDECIGFGLTVERNFTRDRDVEPSTSINFRFLLQNLG
ncbi:MAG: LPS-assembly protein LptD [Rhodospirillaceae bacterium]|nr:LPS-assembly protein LptD [Rhodospirillaceae bacterium]MBT4490024.1 LPS-assembly protein LptD [Rhodospirillaceae bacterium]MBT5895333.1 LPS-assembly protein LptD [Rhodospirillaceae bacterium]MBT6428557.1 LPS-assembly protein LptD [Rhodospirillaceae bacterium]